jgi:hypothetical protein
LSRAESDLIVTACDSGSDKLFDFAGLADVVQKIKEIIESVWDRAIFHRERKLSERLELISKSLPIVEQISALQNNGNIAPELAENIRRKITSGVIGFLETGCLIPEIQAQTSFDPVKILPPQEILLLAPPGSVSPEDKKRENSSNLDHPTDDPLTTVTPEERARLEAILKNIRGSE